jgi:hypothetical protein
MKKIFPAILLTLSAFMLSGLWLASLPSHAADKDAPGQTEVLKWKDGKRAVFMLEFDDSCESHVKIVITGR